MVRKKTSLWSNARFYVLIFSLLLSVFIPAVLRTYVSSDEVWESRVQQLYGYTSILFLYLALMISATTTVFGRQSELARLMIFCRRAIGVSSAYFAALHVFFAYIVEVESIDTLSNLPSGYLISFLFGSVAVIILVIMAATSFNAVVKELGYFKWKWLHRTVYLAALLIILHVWMIGVYVGYSSVQIIGFALLTVLFGLESVRIARSVANRVEILQSKDYKVVLILSIWIVFVGCLLIIPEAVGSKHIEDHTTRQTELARIVA